MRVDVLKVYAYVHINIDLIKGFATQETIGQLIYCYWQGYSLIEFPKSSGIGYTQGESD